MASQPRVLIAGGYGTFGRLLARALAELPLGLLIAGRDERKASAIAQEVRAEAMVLDLNDLDAVASAARGCLAVVCTAGPFQDLDRRLPSIVAETGAHWLDTADDAGWILDQIDLTKNNGAAIIPGLSSTPALTGVLARWCAARVPDATRACVSLLIGNRNAKGAGSIASVLMSGLDDPISLSFPAGSRTAYRFPSSDRELLARALGVRAEMRVAFGWKPTGAVASALGRVIPKNNRALRRGLVRSLTLAVQPLSVLGHSGGTVAAEVWDRSGKTVSAALSSEDQSIAIAPCVVAIEELLAGRIASGVHEPGELLGLTEWLERLHAKGLRFHTREALERPVP